jgi:micrococcal nuclease
MEKKNMSRFPINRFSQRLIINGISRILKLNRNQKTMFSAVIILVIAIASYLFLDQNKIASYSYQRGVQQSNLQEGIWQVSHIVDGDTIDVIDNRGQKHRIRFIGANAPETAKKNIPAEHYANRAMETTKRIIAVNGNKVRIAFDGDRIDKYGRNLAMVYVSTPRGEIWLNEFLIQEGLARARLQYNFSNIAKEKLKRAELNAKNARKNIWSSRKN